MAAHGAALRRAAHSRGRRSAQYSGSRPIGSIGVALASPSSTMVSATAPFGGNDASARPRRIAAPRDARRVTSPLRTDRRMPQPARRRQAARRRRAPGTRRTIGVSIEDKSREALRAPLPRRPRVMKPCRLLASAGIRAGGVPARLPARFHAQWPAPACDLHAKRARAGLRHATRPLTVAGAAQVGDLRAEHAPCFPFNRATHTRAPRRRQFRSGPHERQESARTHAGSASDAHIRGKKRGCYDWKRYRCRNARYSALKCWVFRGRSRCSTNSKLYLKILAV